MATSNPYSSTPSSNNRSGDGNFFTSRKNIVGMTLATTVIVLHLALGFGFLWPVAAAAAWGAGVALTPSPQRKQLEAPRQPMLPAPVELNGKLTDTLKPLYDARPPKEVSTQAREMEDNLRFVLAHWDDLEMAPQHQQNVWDIVNIYLPEVVTTYLDAPQYRSPEAADVMAGSLGTLTSAAGKVKQGILDQNLRAMDSQARTLREAFGDLPGLDGNTAGYDERP